MVSQLKSLKRLYLNNCGLHEKMIDFSNLTNLVDLGLGNNSLWTSDLENLRALKSNKNLTIDLRNNTIIDARILLDLDESCKIYLGNNINLSQESKDALKAKFGNRLFL